MNKIFMKEEFISAATLDIINRNSDHPENAENLFYQASYIAHRHFKINLICVDHSVAGYYIFREGSGNLLKSFSDIYDFGNEVDDNEEYLFMMNFEIFKGYRNHGYETHIVEILKEEQLQKGNKLLILMKDGSDLFLENNFSGDNIIMLREVLR